MAYVVGIVILLILQIVTLQAREVKSLVMSAAKWRARFQNQVINHLH